MGKIANGDCCDDGVFLLNLDLKDLGFGLELELEVDSPIGSWKSGSVHTAQGFEEQELVGGGGSQGVAQFKDALKYTSVSKDRVEDEGSDDGNERDRGHVKVGVAEAKTFVRV